MVSNVIGEIHGAVPATPHCGTALTGSQDSIDAIGTWMNELVGLLDNQDLPLALRSTTQITTFQRRSMSLHSLKDLGIDCAHRLTQAGNFLDISVNGVTHVFPLLTINGGDYVEMRINCPPPASVAAFLWHNLIWQRISRMMVCTICSIFDMDAQDGKQWNSSFSQIASQGFWQMYLSLRSFAALYVTKKRQTHSPQMKSPIKPFFLSVHDLERILDSTIKHLSMVLHVSCLLLSTSQDTNGSSANDQNNHLLT
jgi:hypothetical protein